MNRNERRALAHKERKLSSKLARAAEASHPPVAAVATAASALDIREPGGVFPPLSAIAPTLAPVSDTQLAANRANSLKSSGPKTELGAETHHPRPRPSQRRFPFADYPRPRQLRRPQNRSRSFAPRQFSGPEQP